LYLWPFSRVEWAWAGTPVEANGARLVRVAPSGVPRDGETYAVRAEVVGTAIASTARVTSAMRRSVTLGATVEPTNGTGPWRVCIAGIRFVVAPSVPSGLTCVIDGADLLLSLASTASLRGL
jgi:hypothetical protein